MHGYRISPIVVIIGCLLFNYCAYAGVDAKPRLSPPPQGLLVAQQAPAPQPAQKFQHAPYAEQMCEACHGSDKPSRNDIAEEPPDMCYNCHDEYSHDFVHAPVSVGACLLCHDPHQSDNSLLLLMKIPNLCYQCHDRIQEMMTNEKLVTHSPAVDSCTECHNPHGSNINNKFFQKDMTSLCKECHIQKNVPMEKYVASVTYKHKPIEDAERCAHCHAPHASPFEFHLRAAPMDLCLSCHNKEVTAYDGQTLANMESLLRNNPSWHGPIREKNCAGCHNAHGSSHFRILRHAYPKAFYTDTFSQDNFGLCFSCHEPTLLRDRETTTLTNFRDGKRNLHFLHVNRAEKGRTCRACHETHASTHPKHIRDAVPFGKIRWPIQLKYQVAYVDVRSGKSCDTPSATCVKTGGSCVGCHKRSHYNYRKAD